MSENHAALFESPDRLLWRYKTACGAACVARTERDSIAACEARDAIGREILARLTSPSGVSGMTETPERAELDAIKFLHAGDDRVWCVGCKRFAWCDGDNECPKDDASECPIQNEPDAVAAPSIADAQEALDALAKECRDLDDSLLAAPRASSLGEPVSQEAPHGARMIARDLKRLLDEEAEMFKPGRMHHNGPRRVSLDVEVHRGAQLVAFVEGFDRLSASAPSPEDKGSEDTRLLAEIRAKCRVVYYPPEVGTYPIEHSAIAGKDMWDAIVWALRDRSQDQPSVPVTEGRDPGGEA